MDKETALKAFYQLNQIDPGKAADPLDAGYDPRLAALPQKVGQWLENVDASDRPVFLKLLNRYCYLSRVQCQLRYGQILSSLGAHLAGLQIRMEEVLIVTIEAGGAYASGGPLPGRRARQRHDHVAGDPAAPRPLPHVV